MRQYLTRTIIEHYLYIALCNEPNTQTERGDYHLAVCSAMLEFTLDVTQQKTSRVAMRRYPSDNVIFSCGIRDHLMGTSTDHLLFRVKR